jgi:hypothetical protein
MSLPPSPLPPESSSPTSASSSDFLTKSEKHIHFQPQPTFSSPSERRLIIATALNTVASACASQSSPLSTSLSSFNFKAPSTDSIETHSGTFFYGATKSSNRSLILLTEPLMCFQRGEGCEFSGFSRSCDDERTFRTALAKQLYGLLGVPPTWRLNARGEWAIYLD